MREPTRCTLFLVLALALAVGACTAHSSFRQAELAAQRSDWDGAVLHYLKALDEDPGNLTYRAALLRAKIKASQGHFEKGQEFEKAGVVERALIEYQQAVQLDPTNQYAKAQLERMRDAYAALRQNRSLSSIEEMKQKAKGSRPQPPILNPRSKQPISLEFPQPVSVFSIYRALGQAFGINILFDTNLKDQEIAIELKDVTAQAALETLMRAAQHFYKVMDEHTIIVAADTPQNRRLYEDLVIQTFFLSNSEVKDMVTILRSLVDSRKIATNEQLNAVIMRDTADRVKIAEKIIETNDKAKAEVVIDVELLQINSQRLRELGMSLSSYSIGQSLSFGTPAGTGGAAAAAGIRLSDLEFVNQSNWLLTIPSFLYNFVKTNSEAQLLAKPQLRITEGEKAMLTIGDRVPIPLTTFNTQNAGATGGIVPITSFQYQDVGIRIELEPRVHHNHEVTLKVRVEVSNLAGTVSSGGQEQPIIGTRNFDSTIRLQDGETNFLAGLIRSDETTSDRGIPGLSEIPILGRLFSNKRVDNQRTDVILTLTPHIIRNAEITDEDLLPIWVGTEQHLTFRPGPRVESEVEGPFDTGEGTPEEIQEAIRRRLEQLPRGLRPGESGEELVGEPEETPQPPPGVNLVPVAPPSDFFRQPEPEPPPSEDEPPPAATAAWSQESVASSVAFAAAARPAVRLSLVPERLALEPGAVFTLEVRTAASRPLSHLPLTLTFDPAVLAVEAVEPGDYLGGAGEVAFFSHVDRPGRVVFGASRLGTVAGVTGEGTVARVRFRALAPGSARIDFKASRPLDAKLVPLVPLRTRPARIEVNGPARFGEA